MVFTLPHELVGIILQKRQTLYNVLFRAAAESLLEFAREWKRLRAKVGFTAILHTWTQELLFHPHLHIVVTGGGLNESEDAWISSRTNFLVPVRALSQKYRGKFIDFLKRAFSRKEIQFHGIIEHLHNPDAFSRFIKKLYRKKWVVYSKQPFGGPEQVFRCLGLYTHKVAISNHRLAEMNGGVVAFYARDNQNPGKKRSVIVPTEEFIRRFLLHVLPVGFVKIRHYGLMGRRHAKNKLQLARRLIEQAQSPKTVPSSNESPVPETRNMSWPDILSLQIGINLEICPRCGGNLIRYPLSGLDHPGDFHTPSVFQDSS
jgi:hypothetical protein